MPVQTPLATLQQQIEDALDPKDPRLSVERVKEILSAAVQEGRVALPDAFHEARADHYARRVLFANPALGYSAVVMTWGPGQGTAVHDHAGIWCVEVVVEGQMDVTQYELDEERAGLYRFHPHPKVHARVGSAGCLIPPFEHHVLANALDRPSLTLHVYGGEINRCNVYLPRGDGWYERQERALSYD
jgi:predicted metal-dependent enzyme (double-stranded beta helix superfamily)